MSTYNHNTSISNTLLTSQVNHKRPRDNEISLEYNQQEPLIKRPYIEINSKRDEDDKIDSIGNGKSDEEIPDAETSKSDNDNNELNQSNSNA